MKIHELPLTIKTAIVSTVMQEAAETDFSGAEELTALLKILSKAPANRFRSAADFSNYATEILNVLNSLGLWGFRGPLLRLRFVLWYFGPGADNKINRLAPHLKRSKAKIYLEQ